MNKEYYGLYHNKEKMEITIIKNPNCAINSNDVTDEVIYFNNCYYVSTNRKALMAKAENLREEWIDEAKEVLNKLLSMVIKRKHKKLRNN